LLVPHRERAQWLADWQAEAWYVERLRSRRSALAFSLGAFQDAIWLRRSLPGSADWLRSALSCLALLAIPAGVSAFFFHASRASAGPATAHLLAVIMALVILPATMPLTFGEYPRMKRRRRWMFVAVKFLLVWGIAFCGVFDLAPLLSARHLQPHATLIAYVLGFRWALLDQRRRCPICLRLLANPTRIGRCSQTLLEWYGTESFCPKGHGLLHAPEITASYTTQRWLDLDASWSSLFR
jgi:hypothetical protein